MERRPCSLEFDAAGPYGEEGDDWAKEQIVFDVSTLFPSDRPPTLLRDQC